MEYFCSMKVNDLRWLCYRNKEYHHLTISSNQVSLLKWGGKWNKLIKEVFLKDK